jgi:hypothetical protein
MKVKMFELRDAGTFVPVFAVKVTARSAKELYLIGRASMHHGGPFVYLVSMLTDKAHWDPDKWDSRTYKVAHRHIIDNWSRLSTASVIDVEYILHLTKDRKKSERCLQK